MTGGARLGSILLCALAMLPATVASAAQGESRLRPEPRSLAFFFESDNGYEVTILTFGDRVALETSRRNVGAFYEVEGRVSDMRIDTRFGRLGRISGRYRRLSLFGDEGPDRNGCEDPLSLVRFTGRISFRGEGGYTAVDERLAIGFLFDPAARRCRQRARRRARQSAVPRGLNTHLLAASKRAGVVTFVTLRRKAGDRRAGLEVLRQERRGEMSVFRRAETAIGGDNALITSGPGVRPPFAFLAPPKPFSGSAVFDPTAPAGGGWSGALSAWLPGLGKTGLTGPDYAISFCRRANDEPGCDPEAPVRASLAAPQGSGSQSQLLAEARLSWSRYLRNSASSAGSTP